MLMIIFVHSVNEYADFGSLLSRSLLVPHFGEIGCDVFFFMSAYGLYHAYNKPAVSRVNYLLRHLRTLLTAFVSAYCIMLVASALQPGHEGFSASNILTLTMPDGTDMWFFKITLLNYLVMFLLYMSEMKEKNRRWILVGVYCALVVLMWACGAHTYWYVSDMCFASGYLAASISMDKKRHTYLTAALSMVAIAYCVLISPVFELHNAPMYVIGNTAMGYTFVMLWNRLDCGHPGWLLFIGRNSLYFYLYSVAAMLITDSSEMHWICYFAIVLLLTTIFVATHLAAKDFVSRHSTLSK